MTVDEIGKGTGWNSTYGEGAINYYSTGCNPGLWYTIMIITLTSNALSGTALFKSNRVTVPEHLTHLTHLTHQTPAD